MSNFHPDTRDTVLVTLFRLACSVVLWGGRNTANKHHWHVLTVIQPHWVCPCSCHVGFSSLHCSDSRLLCWALSDGSPGLHALPMSKLFRFRFSDTPQRHRLGWGCILHPSQVRAAQMTRCLARKSPPVEGCGLSPPPSQPLGFLGVQWVCLLRCAVCLFWGADLWMRPSQWMSTFQNPKKSWLAAKSAHSLV